MKIIINNVEFPFNEGCRLLKLKYDKCPMKEIEDFWEDIVPMNFKDIAVSFTNTEQRRVGILCLGLEKLVSEVNPRLIKSETIKKETTWVDENGVLQNHKFNDIYELYEVDGSIWGENERKWNIRNVHYVKCKDTSTDREYFLWVNAQDVYSANDTRESRWYSSNENYGNLITPIQSIAWTIQTDIKEGGIEKIIRQGDCIMIKKKPNAKKGDVRHLTEKEYLTLLKEES
jgi:hypothetical protein